MHETIQKIRINENNNFYKKYYASRLKFKLYIAAHMINIMQLILRLYHFPLLNYNFFSLMLYF
jgi:hypothetical protein